MGRRTNEQRIEPLIVRATGLIGAVGFVVTLLVASVGLPGPIHGLFWRTSANAADYNVALKVVAGVGAMFVALLALGRFELSRNERRQAASALDYSEQTLFEGQYVRAVNQLASDQLMVQIGGMYSLDLLYVHSARHRAIAVRALCAFVRTYHDRAPEPRSGTSTPPEAIVVAVSVLRNLRGLPTGLELKRANLDWTSFDGSTMWGSDLGRATLRHATLTRTNLTWSTLRGADLTGADLSGAVLDWCNLAGAVLTEATLSGASLHNAVLTSVDLSQAEINGADLTDVTWDPSSPPIWPASFTPPERRRTIGHEELDQIRARAFDDRHLPYRYDTAMLRQHRNDYIRTLASVEPSRTAATASDGSASGNRQR